MNFKLDSMYDLLQNAVECQSEIVWQELVDIIYSQLKYHWAHNPFHENYAWIIWFQIKVGSDYLLSLPLGSYK